MSPANFTGSVAERVAFTLAQLLADDPRRVILGEDVTHGSMLGLTRAVVADPELRDRALGLPLLPASLVAHAAGLALGGQWPIVVLPSLVSLAEGYAALRELAALRDQGASSRALPLLILAPIGGGLGLGGEFSGADAAMLTAVCGLRVVAASTADALVSRVRACAEFASGEDPTVLLLPRASLLASAAEPDSTGEDEVAEGAPTAIDAARVLREGDEVTVLSWGEAVASALAGAARSSRSVTVVDVVSLAPLDRARISQAASRTGRVLIVHAGADEHTAGRLAAYVADDAILTLDAPVRRLCGTHAPTHPRREASLVPSPDAVAQAIESLASY